MDPSIQMRRNIYNISSKEIFDFAFGDDFVIRNKSKARKILTDIWLTQEDKSKIDEMLNNDPHFGRLCHKVIKKGFYEISDQDIFMLREYMGKNFDRKYADIRTDPESEAISKARAKEQETGLIAARAEQLRELKEQERKTQEAEMRLDSKKTAPQSDVLQTQHAQYVKKANKTPLRSKEKEPSTEISPPSPPRRPSTKHS